MPRKRIAVSHRAFVTTDGASSRGHEMTIHDFEGRASDAGAGPAFIMMHMTTAEFVSFDEFA